MKKFVSAGSVAVAVTALVAFGSVSPAVAAPTVVAPIVTADTATGGFTGRNYYNYAAVSNDGSLVAAIGEFSGITIYTVADGSQRDISMTALGTSEIATGAFSPDNNWLYVTDKYNDTVIVIDLSDDSINRTINVGFDPWGIEASQDGSTLYVHEYSGDLKSIDLSNNDTVSSALSLPATGSPYSSCLSSDGATLYIPDWSTGIFVVDTATMTLTSQWDLGAFGKNEGCEFDNDGNLIIADYNNSTVVKVSPANGNVLSTTSASQAYVIQAVPSCDTIYVPDTNGQANIETADVASLTWGTAIVPAETPAGDGFYGGNGSDRSLDGSVVALGGYYSTDGLVIIQTPECSTSSQSGGDSTPQLPNTGVDTATTAISMAVAGGALLAGVIALVALRRRQA